MSELTINTRATLKTLNPRKEGPGDEKVLALDAKLEAEVDVDVLATILGAEDRNRLRNALWSDDQDGNPLFWGITSIKAADSEFAELAASIANVKLHGARARKFEATPRGGPSVSLTFTLTVHDPPENAMPILAEHLGEPVGVDIHSEQRELPFSGETAA